MHVVSRNKSMKTLKEVEMKIKMTFTEDLESTFYIKSFHTLCNMSALKSYSFGRRERFTKCTIILL